MIDVTPPPDRSGPRDAATRRRDLRAERAPVGAERAALWLQFGLALVLEAAFLAAGWTLVKSLPYLPIEPWQKVAFQVGLGLAFLVFGLRALRLWRRLHAGATTDPAEDVDPTER